MQIDTPICSVIIPVFNKWELTKNCLASLCEHSVGHNIEVIVVNNGSSDETATELQPYGRTLFGERFLAITFSENKNFGPACNAGAQAATSSVLFFLNNDTLLTPEWLPPLLDGLYTLGIRGAVGPLLLYEDGSVQHLGVTYGLVGPFHLYSHFPVSHPVVSRKRKLQSLTGAAFMIRTDFFRECGEFHEAYRNGFEDLDLCIQIQQRGGKLRCIPTSRIYHLESQTPGRKKHEDYNSELFTQRCAKALHVDLHHHFQRDGFSYFINDLLTISPKLKEEDALVLTKKAQGQDAPSWLHLVRENPYWIYGREVLAQSYERQKYYTEAAIFRAELTDIEPLIKRYKDLLRLTPFVENPSWQDTAESHYNIMLRLRNDWDYARASMAKKQQRLRHAQDTLLEKALMAKMAEWFPQG